MVRRNFEVLFLSLSPGSPDPWGANGRNLPAHVHVQKLALTLSPDTAKTPSGQKVSHIVVDLDSVNKTKGLDAWAISAWKSTINEWVVKNIDAEHPSIEVLGFCLEPTWAMARLGARLGMRDLLGPEDLDTKFLPHDAPSHAAASPSGQLFSFAELKTRIDQHKSGKSLSDSVPGSSEEDLAQVSAPKRNSDVPAPPPSVHDRLHSPADLEAQQDYEVLKHVIPFPIDGLDGQSPGIEAVRRLIRRTAPLDTPVLITGATGSGKELAAKTLHRYSPRAQGPFIAVNCGAISANIVESELFGHVKGSFTSASSDKMGILQAANGGTLFLDELTELSPEIQVKFLRALQERLIYPVGSSQAVSVDFRLISATKEDILEKVREGKFREDLYYRLKVIEIALPSLAERRTDLPEITKSILKRISRKQRRPLLDISESALEKFLLYDWPGNIRELENVLERAATLVWAESRSLIQAEDLTEEIRFSTMKTGNSQHLKEVVRRFEREYISSTIRRLGGSKELAADSLGLSLATLYRKLGS